MEDDRARDANAEEVLRSETSIPKLMRTAARLAAETLDGDACAISRILGDVLVELAEFAGTRKTLYLGHGYLVSDYPLTREVIERREPRTVHAPDPDADEAEVAILGELGFTSLVMVPICAADHVWGLAEIYREGVQRFVDADAVRAKWLFDVVGERVAELEGTR
jgi:GAF domain-containing protein